jgi:RHS repeat-associated protein
VAEVDGSGAVVVLYVRAGDMLLEEVRGGVAKMYEADGLGSIRGLLDGSGARTDSYSYEAFGSTLSSTGNDENPYRFAGERFVEAAGMYQNRARWLDTRTGRFTTYDHGPPTGYGYVSGNPVSFADPSGYEMTVAETMITGACVSAMATVVLQYARGQAMSLNSAAEILTAGAIGAVTGPAVLVPKVAAALGVSAATLATVGLYPLLSDPSIPLERRAAAYALLAATYLGAAQGLVSYQIARSSPNLLANIKAGGGLLTPRNGKINVGGGNEANAELASNLNPIVEGTGGPPGSGIPNWVNGGFEEIAMLFEPASADLIYSNRLTGNTVDWARAAAGAAQVLKPGGRLSLNIYGGLTEAELQAAAAAFKAVGFKVASAVWNPPASWITGVR